MYELILEDDSKFAKQIVQRLKKDFKESVCINIKKHQGRLVKPIPYNTGLNKKVAYLLYQLNCYKGCVYCYLQGYFKNNQIVIYSNYEDLLEQVEEFKRLKFDFFYAGELNDSLLFDKYTNYTKILIPFFSKKKLNLELRTKDTFIDNLMSLKEIQGAIVSWSLNPQKIIDYFEPNTKSLQERLTCAKKLKEYGYRIAFHIDPIILIDNWQDEYLKLIQQIEVYVKQPEYISLGCFRFNKELKHIILKNHPDKYQLFLSEFFPSPDGKYRYFKFLRKYAYLLLKEKIRKVFPNTFVYICMDEKITHL